MTIEKLKRFPQEAEPAKITPRCDANVSVASKHERQWRLGRYGESNEPFRCSRASVVRLGGKHYCRLHGGHVALDMAINGKLIEPEAPPEEKCAICKGKHNNDLLTDICKACEANINENGSP
jgi:hypothetical protein